ncbi:hypothetical protein P5673_000268, partial [Acropora cervicornis]
MTASFILFPLCDSDMQNDKHPLGNCLQLKEDEMLQKFSDNFETEKLCGKVRSCHGGSQQYEK